MLLASNLTQYYLNNQNDPEIQEVLRKVYERLDTSSVISFNKYSKWFNNKMMDTIDTGEILW